MKAIIVGGGAAGFFAAINLARHNPGAEVIILEKTQQLLSKVKVSGGGRCNVTNSEQQTSQLVKNYPRGNKELKSVFSQFSTTDTFHFFNQLGVNLKIENDGRVFPISDNSQTIIDCLIGEAKRLGISIKTGINVKTISDKGFGFEVEINKGEILHCDKILIATGGSPKFESYQFIQKLKQDIISPVPSLFTFNIPDHKLKGLQGLSVEHVLVRIQGQKLFQEGPVLITHWGLSGPAIIKLSAWFARQLNDIDYKFNVVINWLPEFNEESLRIKLGEIKNTERNKKICNSAYVFKLPKRLWERFTELADISSELKWGDISKKQINVLIQELVNGTFPVHGKTTFKEEFVTAGGVKLSQVNLATMESKVVSNLYFAGEVLDIDGITGGFNFQAAWSTGYIAGVHMAKMKQES